MTLGMWLALLAVGLCGGFAWWIWSLRGRVAGAAWKAAMVFSFGVLMGTWAWWNDSGLSGETLFEAVAEGSVGARAGASAPERHFSFEVQHPGVEHSLTIYPEYPAPTVMIPSANVLVRVLLRDPQGKGLIDHTHEHTPYGRKRYWTDKRHAFVPAERGKYTLMVVPLTVNIPAVHVRVVDPQLKTGKRAAGY